MVQSAVSGDEGRVFENLRWVSGLPMKLEMLHCKIAAPDEHTIRLRRVRGRGSACKSSGKFRNGAAVLSKPAPDPIPQLPNIAPTQVIVSAPYPGASAHVVADTEKTPFEQRIIGSTKDAIGSVNRTGEARCKQNLTFALTVNLTSSGGSVDPVALSNRACLQIADPLERFAGAGDAAVLGERYLMRVDLDKLVELGIAAVDVSASDRQAQIG